MLASVLAGVFLLGLPACKLLKSSGGADGGGGGGFGLGALIDLVGFEGEIDFSVSIGSTPVAIPSTKMTLLVKGQRMAYDVGTMRIVVDGAGKKAYVVNDAAKEYTVSDTSSAPKAATPPTPAKVTKTSTHDKVAGLDCEIWNVSEGTNDIEVCAARGLSFVGLGMAFGGFAGAGASDWMSAVGNAGYFPLRAVGRASTGAELWRIEVTRMDKKSVPDTKFAIPPGYTDRTVPVVPVTPAAKSKPATPF